jgi:hypothetical protein
MKIVEQKIILEQPADSDAENDIEQYMTVRALDCGAGPFVVIETARWAIDPDEIIMLGDHLDCGGFLAQNQVLGFVA